MAIAGFLNFIITFTLRFSSGPIPVSVFMNFVLYPSSSSLNRARIPTTKISKQRAKTYRSNYFPNTKLFEISSIPYIYLLETKAYTLKVWHNPKEEGGQLLQKFGVLDEGKNLVLCFPIYVPNTPSHWASEYTICHIRGRT